MLDKGFVPMWVILTTVLIIIVISSLIEWNLHSAEKFNSAVERKAYLNLHQGINDVKQMVALSLKNSGYNAIQYIGNRIENGKNYYLKFSEEDGIGNITNDIKTWIAEELDNKMCNSSLCTDNYLFNFGSFNITASRISAEDIEVTTDENEFLVISTKLKNITATDYQNWEYNGGDIEISTLLRARLFDMYRRAKGFDKCITGMVPLVLPLAINTKLAIRAYAKKIRKIMSNKTGGPLLVSGSSEPYIVVGDVAHDPISAILYAKPETIKQIASDPHGMVDIGAIPGAVLFCELTELTEPSVYPPGIDLSLEDLDDYEDGITNLFSFQKQTKLVAEAVCNEDSESEACKQMEENSDANKLRERVNKSEQTLEKLSDLRYEVGRWVVIYSKEKFIPDSCTIIGKMLGEAWQCARDEREYQIDEACDYHSVKEVNARDLYENTHQVLDKISKLFGGAKNIPTSKDIEETQTNVREDASEKFKKEVNSLKADSDLFRRIYNSVKNTYKPRVDSMKDVGCNQTAGEVCPGCSQIKWEYDSDTCSSDKGVETITKTISPDCKKPTIKCTKTGSDTRWVECIAEPIGTYSEEVEYSKRVCKATSYKVCVEKDENGECIEKETRYKCDCKTKRRTHTFKIPTCRCKCVPEEVTYNNLFRDMCNLYNGLTRGTQKLAEYIVNTKQKIRELEKSAEIMKEFEEVHAEPSRISYDVKSRLTITNVNFSESGSKTYSVSDITYADRGISIKGNREEADLFYAGQIAAATILTLIPATASIGAKLLGYLKNLYYGIYSVNAEFTMSESIVDESNMEILTNVGGVYTYGGIQFKIYEDYQRTVHSDLPIFLPLYAPFTSEETVIQIRNRLTSDKGLDNPKVKLVEKVCNIWNLWCRI